jgi:hypothetical protein
MYPAPPVTRIFKGNPPHHVGIKRQLSSIQPNVHCSAGKAQGRTLIERKTEKYRLGESNQPEVGGREAARINPKSKSAEQVLYLLCGAFTYSFALVMFSL